MLERLQPLMLNSAMFAFDGYYFEKTYVRGDHFPMPMIPKPHAIYQLLIDGRESFARVLVNRKTKDVSAVMKENYAFPTSCYQLRTKIEPKSLLRLQSKSKGLQHFNNKLDNSALLEEK
jgi:hypothetical protein